ncbi:hypothetical protein BDA99DRAFT_543781 [Phascolomyces articulosus]|uniref:Uncharacterized protein n=1 Tax=Phascolomyces articulosus TaxID=60185 RepID=A0AAD5P8Z8_9FUNG|nr:hypothetical protein BDA99DRAFT_543781 [Phascolomyces articulosus]
MDITGYTLGTAIPTIVLGAVATLGSTIQYTQTRQFQLGYSFIFLAGSCLIIIRSIFLAEIYGPSSYDAAMAMNWFSQMFIPFLFCVLFEACRTIIITNTTRNTQQHLNSKNEETAMLETNNSSIISSSTSPQQQESVKILLSISYFAYFFTVILIITNAIATALILSSLSSLDENMYDHIIRLEYFNVYGIWIYVFCAIIQLVNGSSFLGRSIRSLYIYFIGLMIAMIGHTISNALFMQITIYRAADSTSFSLVQYITVEIVGGIALIYACLWCSTHSWKTSPSSIATIGSVQPPHYQ